MAGAAAGAAEVIGDLSEDTLSLGGDKSSNLLAAAAFDTPRFKASRVVDLAGLGEVGEVGVGCGVTF